MIKKTYRPEITAYESILLILSKLVEKGKTVLRQDKLVPFLYGFIDSDTVKPLFVDIAFDTHLDTITSVDVEDSLTKLQTYGAIGKLNPAYEKIVIYISQKEARDFISSYNEQFVVAAEEIAEKFDETA